MRDCGRTLPEFIDRFGPAYKAELVAFIDCCLAKKPFPTSHRDGLRAQEVVSAGLRAVVTHAPTARIYENGKTAPHGRRSEMKGTESRFGGTSCPLGKVCRGH